MALILYQNFVPISLIITVEIVKTIQSWLIFNDIDLYYSVTDSATTPRNWNIADDLGQVGYIFSDKTGTLTQNVMHFRMCSTGDGKIYGSSKTDLVAYVEISHILREKVTGEFEKLNDLFLAISLCHSVLVQGSMHDGSLSYKAQSPDEGALITSAQRIGYTFFQRTNDDELKIDIFGVSHTYKLLNVIEFNSERKRMTVILRTDDGSIILLTKGADSVIFQLLAGNQEAESSQLDKDLGMYAEEGKLYHEFRI